MLALLPLLLSAPQSSQVFEVMLQKSEPVPGLAPSTEVRDFYPPHPGRGGGWTAWVLVYDPAASDPTYSVIVGQRPGQVDGPAELLRAPMLLQGIQQTSIGAVSMANGQVAYVAGHQPGQAGVWIEDDLILTSGDVIGGTAGWTWQYFNQVELTTSGDMLISGTAVRPMGGTREILWRWPQEEVLLRQGQSLAGYGTISSFESYLSVSPNGQHWSRVVRRGIGLDFGIAVDGEIFEAAPGRPVIVGSAVPPGVAGSLGPSLWDGFQFPVHLNDRGDWALESQILTLAGNQHSLIARNGRAYLDGNPFADMVGLDARGAILNLIIGGFLNEGQPVADGTFAVDLDGDGAVDPGIQACNLTRFGAARPGSDALTLLKVRLNLGTGCNFANEAIVRARPMRVDLPICEGVNNSTGYPGQLVVGGSTRVQENELSLQLFGLPENAPCYALLSRSPGFAANPGGSQGNLCLGGGIGRMVLSLFVAGQEGRGEVAIDLTAMREPNGYVAALPGERWFFQAWYRDSVAGMATSNFTSASGVQID